MRARVLASRTLVIVAAAIAILTGLSLASAASLNVAGGTIQVLTTVWPTPHLTATVRVLPQTVDLRAAGNITAFVDGLPSPYSVTQIDMASIQLCYQSKCAASNGPATLDPTGKVAAAFPRPVLAQLVSSDRGDLVLTVQGKLTDGSTFSGQYTNHVNGKGDIAPAPDGGTPAPVATPVASPSPGPASTPSPSATQVARPSPIASPSPSPAGKPSDAPSPSIAPSDTPGPSPRPSPTVETSPVATRTPSSPPPSSPTSPSTSPSSTPSPTAS